MPDPYMDAIEAIRRAIDSITDPKEKQKLIDAVEKLRRYLNSELQKLAKKAGVPSWTEIPSWVGVRKQP